MNKIDFSYYVKKYLSEYLVNTLNTSNNTIQSYRDTFKLLITYFIEHKKIKIISIDNYNYENILSFLDWLESNRNSSVRSRNQRLACLKSFSKFILINNPTLLYECQKIINIPFKKYQQKEIKYLNKEEVKIVLSKPDINSKYGFKEAVILSLLYSSGMRISELINTKRNCLKLDYPSSINVIGKGNKIRCIPLTEEMTKLLKKYIEVFNNKDDDFLFISNQKRKYTGNGIRYIINKYCVDINFKVTPHTFRHSMASHLLDTDTSLIYIRDFLGHEHLSTTEIYAKVNVEKKREIIEKNKIEIESNQNYNWNTDTELMSWLKSF